MIVLDTNVLSGLMRSQPAMAVAEWMDDQPQTSLWTTAVTVFEVRFGLSIMPLGKKREYLEVCFERILWEDFEGRVLHLDEKGAQLGAEMKANLRSTGIDLDFRDAQIAGIVASRNATLATRNMKHFENTGIDLINPWDG